MTCACRAHALPTTSSGTGQVRIRGHESETASTRDPSHARGPCLRLLASLVLMGFRTAPPLSPFSSAGPFGYASDRDPTASMVGLTARDVSCVQVAWTRAYLHGASASARLRTLRWAERRHAAQDAAGRACRSMDPRRCEARACRTSPARSGSWVARSAQSGVQDSTATTDREAAWREAVQLMRSGEVRQYKAIRCNRGGVIVQASDGRRGWVHKLHRRSSP